MKSIILIPCLFLCGWGCSASDLPSEQINVSGIERAFRLFTPSENETTPRPLILAFHGGSGRDSAFPQESKFNELAEREGVVVLYPLSRKLPQNEGEWQLNTTAETRHDIEFVDALIDMAIAEHGVDPSRVYATGYSLGSMFTYELACQMSDRIAAVASYAGSMPVEPEECVLQKPVAVSHIHGDDDWIIPYADIWEWKDWDSVGRMRDVPGLIEYWRLKNQCESSRTRDFGASAHTVFEPCAENVRVELYRLAGAGHGWPDTIDGNSTHQVIWDFLSEFSSD